MSMTTREQPGRVKDVAQRSQQYVWASPPAGRPRRMHGALVFLISAALIASVGMLYLLQTSHVANLGYEMSRLQEEREAALVEQQQLSAQIAEKQALTNVETIAREDLGMQSIDDYVFLDVTLPTAEAPVATDPAPSKPSAIERFWGRLTGRASDSTGGGGHD
ncbi:MAG: hypothetical protein R3A46_01875 [Thermomicrobiales bacterium]